MASLSKIQEVLLQDLAVNRVSILHYVHYVESLCLNSCVNDPPHDPPMDLLFCTHV
jgi:hypothetical protein